MNNRAAPWFAENVEHYVAAPITGEPVAAAPVTGVPVDVAAAVPAPANEGVNQNARGYCAETAEFLNVVGRSFAYGICCGISCAAVGALFGWSIGASVGSYQSPCIEKPNRNAVSLCAVSSNAASQGALYAGAISGGLGFFAGFANAYDRGRTRGAASINPLEGAAEAISCIASCLPRSR